MPQYLYLKWHKYVDTRRYGAEYIKTSGMYLRRYSWLSSLYACVESLCLEYY